VAALRFALAGVLALVCAFSSSARAQEAPPQDFTHQYQTWLNADFQGPVYGDVFIFGDAQYRAWDDFTPATLIARGGLLWRPMTDMFVGAGYGWQPGWRQRGTNGFFDEHRIFEHFAYEWVEPSSGIKLHFRTRLEQRFRYPAGVEVGVRVRQRVRLIVPLTDDKALLFLTWDELMFALNDAGHSAMGTDSSGQALHTPQWQFAGYDQNRLFVGMGYQFIPGVVRLEVGYLNQWQRRPGNALGDVMNHIFFVGTTLGWR
jgi:Protein of unknown function (DUF2490)